MTPLARAIGRRLACLILCAGPAWAWADEAAWAALARPGAVVLFRHANAPGIGDPPGMRLGDCATQRNLDEAGRQQARQIGAAFRGRGIQVGAVLSSQWCRSLETARLAFGSSGVAVREEPAFNSFFAGQGDPVRQGAQARSLLARWQGPGVLVVVTHQVNITDLTGIVPATGEGIVLVGERGAAPRVAGRLPAP